MTVQNQVYDARDDLCASLLAAGVEIGNLNAPLVCTSLGIPPSKVKHPSLQGFWRKTSKFAGCYPQDDKEMQLCVDRVYKVY